RPRRPAGVATTNVARSPTPLSFGMSVCDPLGPPPSGPPWQAISRIAITMTAPSFLSAYLRSRSLRPRASPGVGGARRQPHELRIVLRRPRLVWAAGLEARCRDARIVRDAKTLARELVRVWSGVLQHVDAHVLVGRHDVCVPEVR